MPFAIPLRNVPAPPIPQAQYTDSVGLPTRELLEYLKRLEDWAKSVQAALEQIEP